jgi:hypothetical protein
VRIVFGFEYVKRVTCSATICIVSTTVAYQGTGERSALLIHAPRERDHCSQALCRVVHTENSSNVMF